MIKKNHLQFLMWSSAQTAVHHARSRYDPVTMCQKLVCGVRSSAPHIPIVADSVAVA